MSLFNQAFAAKGGKANPPEETNVITLNQGDIYSFDLTVTEKTEPEYFDWIWTNGENVLTQIASTNINKINPKLQ